MDINFDAIETTVQKGKTVFSSENSFIEKAAINTVEAGETATLYLNPLVFGAIRRWFWTPKRIEAAELKPVSAAQAAKIKTDFDIELDGHANSLDCPRCDHSYSTYEFIQQGIEEHGEKVVRAAFSVKQVGILQINPRQFPKCQNCKLNLLIGSRGIRVYYHYDYSTNDGGAYACCQSATILTAITTQGSVGQAIQ